MTCRIFIVEDHPSMRSAYTMVINAEPDLEICGEAESAEETLEILDDFNPDLLLVDISLPGMSGIDLLRELQNQKRNLASIVVSGHDDRTYIDQILKYGASAYVMKHQGPDVLLETIRQVIFG